MTWRWELAAGATAQLLLLVVLASTGVSGAGASTAGLSGAGLSGAGWAVGLAYGGATWALLTAGMRRTGARALGPANLVTLGRTVLIGGVAALAVDSWGQRAPVVLVVLAAVALVLDVVDGEVARRTGTVSELGATFDMEADAFLLLVLSVLVASVVGWWVLAVGLMRYAFVAASWAQPWLAGPLPASRARKVVGALEGVVLLVVASGVLPSEVGIASVTVALVLLLWSFGRDVLGLWRRRR